MSDLKKSMSGLSGWVAILMLLVLVPLVLGAAAAVLYYLYVPTWRLFLGFDGFWIPVAVLIVGGGIAAAINVPTGIRKGAHKYYLNLLGFACPIGVSVYAAQQIHPTLAWHHVVAWVVCTAIYFVGTWPTEQGVRVSSIAIQATSLGLIGYQHYVFDMPVREVMWWGYTLQYASLIVPDVVRGFVNESRFSPKLEKLSIGGAGAKDALWTAPLSVLTYCFLAQWLFWGGLDAAGK